MTTPQYTSTWNAAKPFGVPIQRPSIDARRGGITNRPTWFQMSTPGIGDGRDEQDPAGEAGERQQDLEPRRDRRRCPGTHEQQVQGREHDRVAEEVEAVADVGRVDRTDRERRRAAANAPARPLAGRCSGRTTAITSQITRPTNATTIEATLISE